MEPKQICHKKLVLLCSKEPAFQRVKKRVVSSIFVIGFSFMLKNGILYDIGNFLVSNVQMGQRLKVNEMKVDKRLYEE